MIANPYIAGGNAEIVLNGSTVGNVTIMDVLVDGARKLSVYRYTGEVLNESASTQLGVDLGFTMGSADRAGEIITAFIGPFAGNYLCNARITANAVRTSAGIPVFSAWKEVTLTDDNMRYITSAELNVKLTQGKDKEYSKAIVHLAKPEETSQTYAGELGNGTMQGTGNACLVINGTNGKWLPDAYFRVDIFSVVYY